MTVRVDTNDGTPGGEIEPDLANMLFDSDLLLDGCDSPIVILESDICIIL